MTRTAYRTFLWMVLISAAVLVGSRAVARVGDWSEQVDLLTHVRHEIEADYVEEPDMDAIVRAGVRGMVEALNDPYTNYISPEELEQFDKAIRGTFSAIGAEIEAYENRIRIVTPLEDSPAWEAGILAGDLILEVDGESTEGMTVNEAVDRLTGKEGTPVVLKVRHESGEEQEIRIVRARIDVPTIKGWRRTADNHWDFMLDSKNKIGYIRITQFVDKTAGALRDAIETLHEDGARGIILDVRFNPGGLLEAATEISDMFLAKDQVILTVKGRNAREHVTRATDEGSITDLPIVILANERSASASEILTGALADNNRAKFIGTRTFGKGSVQQVKMLVAGGAIKITNAYWYTPSGRQLHRKSDESETWGVDPEDGFYVPMSFEDMREMAEVRRNSPWSRANGEAKLPTITPQWIDTELKDPQLSAGLRAMVGFLDTGDWPAVGEAGAEHLARQAQHDELIRQRDFLRERLGELEAEIERLASGEAAEPDEQDDAPADEQGDEDADTP